MTQFETSTQNPDTQRSHAPTTNVEPAALQATEERTAAAPYKLDRLVIGEISAIESYAQAFLAVNDETELGILKSIAADHQVARDTLQARAKQMGTSPSATSGVWGAFATAVESAASTISRDMALRALLEGERMGYESYKAAVNDTEVDRVTREVIARELLPSQQRHLVQLEAMVG